MIKLIAAQAIKYVKFMVWFFAILAFLGLLLKAMQVKQATFELVLGQAGLVGALLLISLSRSNELLEDGKKVIKTAPLFIMAGFLLSWAVLWYRETARQYGIAVTPGAGQLNVPALEAITTDTVMLIVSIILLGPLLEEMLFRFIGLGLVRQLAGPGQATFIIGAGVLITSTMFALLHNPAPAGFVAYFMPSIVYSLVYLKYGVFASFLVHAAGNAWVLIT